jgi:hypothetical protein
MTLSLYKKVNTHFWAYYSVSEFESESLEGRVYLTFEESNRSMATSRSDQVFSYVLTRSHFVLSPDFVTTMYVW